MPVASARITDIVLAKFLSDSVKACGPGASSLVMFVAIYYSIIPVSASFLDSIASYPFASEIHITPSTVTIIPAIIFNVIFS